jgi:hypothetical protein
VSVLELTPRCLNLQGRIEWHPVRKQAYYNITGDAFLSNNYVFDSPRNTIIDSGKVDPPLASQFNRLLTSIYHDGFSGSTLIIAPPGDADKFWSQVPGASRWDQAEGYYTFASL